MKKLTKALKGTIKKLEVKDMAQLKLMTAQELNKAYVELNKCYDYDMTEDENEMVEALMSDIDEIIKDKLAEDILKVADSKPAPAKGKKGAKKTAPAKPAEETAPADKKTANKGKKTAPVAPSKPAPADKPKAPAKPPKAPKTTYDLIKWKSVIQMSDGEGSTFNVYVVDIHPDKKDCICRGLENNLLVFQFLEDELKANKYTDPDNVTWELKVLDIELK